MNTPMRFKYLTIFTLCLYIFLGSFGIDLTLDPDGERYPYHRFLIVITAVIAILNFQDVVKLCLKNKTLMALILYILLASLWSQDSQSAMKNFVFLASALFIAILTVLAFSEKNIVFIRWLFWLFFLMNLASVYVALEYPALGINIKEFGKPRWIGITTHPNMLGVKGLVVIWLGTNLYFLTKNFLEKLTILVAIGVGFLVIIKADSVTSLVDAFLVIECVCYYYIFYRLSTPIKLGTIFLAGFGMLFVAMFFLSGDDLTSSVLKSAGRSSNFSGRTILWDKAMLAFFESPLIGHGFDDLAELTKQYRVLMSHLHSGYIEILVKGGIIAALMMGFILVQTFIDQLLIKSKFRSNYIFLSSGFIMILVHNLTESTLLRGLNPLSIISIYIVVATSYFKNYKTFEKIK